VWSAAFQRCKKRAKILKWRQMRAFSGSVSEWCGRAVAARLLPGSCPVPARFLPGGWFLPGSCPVPARFLPDGRAGTASVGRFLRRSRAATAAPLLGAAPPLCGRFLWGQHGGGDSDKISDLLSYPIWTRRRAEPTNASPVALSPRVQPPAHVGRAPLPGTLAASRPAAPPSTIPFTMNREQSSTFALCVKRHKARLSQQR